MERYTNWRGYIISIIGYSRWKQPPSDPSIKSIQTTLRYAQRGKLAARFHRKLEKKVNTFLRLSISTNSSDFVFFLQLTVWARKLKLDKTEMQVIIINNLSLLVPTVEKFYIWMFVFFLTLYYIFEPEVPKLESPKSNQVFIFEI